jgi:hypothetical protein
MSEPKYQRPELDALCNLGQARIDELEEFEGTLPHCGCGRPADVLHLFAQILAVIEDGDGNQWDRIEALVSEDPGRVVYALLYAIDDTGLTEHGSAVPGWLTDKGKSFLAQYRRLAKEFPERDE